jgi:uncharacterized RDD family membrane protein YckC
MAQGIGLPNGGEEQPRVAALWRRFLAFLLDLAIMGLPALGVGLLFFDEASALEEWGRLIGLALTLLYFGFFDSRLGGGQSPGKRLFQVKVVREDATLLLPAMAALRALILFTPFYLNGVPLDAEASPALLCLVAFLFFGLVLSVTYLLVFDRLRRSLHDLATGAVVVDARAVQLPLLEPVWKGHWIVVGALCATATVSPLLETGPSPTLWELRAIRASVMAMPAVRTAEIRLGRVTVNTFGRGTE